MREKEQEQSEPVEMGEGQGSGQGVKENNAKDGPETLALACLQPLSSPILRSPSQSSGKQCDLLGGRTW